MKGFVSLPPPPLEDTTNDLLQVNTDTGPSHGILGHGGLYSPTSPLFWADQHSYDSDTGSRASVEGSAGIIIAIPPFLAHGFSGKTKRPFPIRLLPKASPLPASYHHTGMTSGLVLCGKRDVSRNGMPKGVSAFGIGTFIKVLGPKLSLTFLWRII